MVGKKENSMGQSGKGYCRGWPGAWHEEPRAGFHSEWIRGCVLTGRSGGWRAGCLETKIACGAFGHASNRNQGKPWDGKNE